MNHEDLVDLTYYRGRVALYAILKALGIGRGDEVLTQGFTCVAVPEAILSSGARPIYVDIEPDGVNLDPDELKRRLSPRVKAIVVQHTFGIPANMMQICKIASDAELPIIEDCCHTLASTVAGRQVGSFGVGAFYSYEWGKPLVVGVGGSARANDDKLRDTLHRQRKHFHDPPALSRRKLEVQYIIHGMLYRPSLFWPLRTAFRSLSALKVVEGNYHSMNPGEELSPEFSQRMGKNETERLRRKLSGGQTAQNVRRQMWALQLRDGLAGVSGIQLPWTPTDSQPVLARFPIFVQQKRRVVAYAKRSNIEVAEWYSTPIHPIPLEHASKVCYDQAQCPNAERRTQEVLSLPLHERVTEGYIERAISLIRSAA